VNTENVFHAAGETVGGRIRWRGPGVSFFNAETHHDGLDAVAVFSAAPVPSLEVGPAVLDPFRVEVSEVGALREAEGEVVEEGLDVFDKAHVMRCHDPLEEDCGYEGVVADVGGMSCDSRNSI
jgi:hypothetical protein